LGRSCLSNALASVALSLILFGVACGSSNESSGSTFMKINKDNAVRDLSSFDGAPFKLAKEYDISRLPRASAAYMGYYIPPDSEPIQDELRIYPDHKSAVEMGIQYAEEVTG
tara:strand:+ start:2295 stop:2630 length:336 start_codon:yes stop_codon:yes gene_type:complete